MSIKNSGGSCTDSLSLEVLDRLTEHLDGFRIDPETILDLGCGLSCRHATWSKRYPEARVIYLDSSRSLLQNLNPVSTWWSSWRSLKTKQLGVVAKTAAIPLPRQSCDLVLAHWLIPWVPIEPLLKEVSRILAPNGLFLFSSLGPDTHKESRHALEQGFGLKNSDALKFIDMHDIGDDVIHQGLSDPVMEREDLTLIYPNVKMLLKEWQSLGGGLRSPPEKLGLTGKKAWDTFCKHYPRSPQGVTATYEVIYGHAWQPAPRQLKDGRSIIDIKTS